MSDDLWNTLKSIQKTLKRWDHVKQRLPESIRNEANEALYTELVDATDSLQGYINDALSMEIRAEMDVNNPSDSLNTGVLSKKLQEASYHFILANRMDLAMELLTAESAIKIAGPSTTPHAPIPSQPTQISPEQMEVLAKLLELGEDQVAKELAQQLHAQVSPKEASGLASLSGLVEEVVWSNRFNREASRWLSDDNKIKSLKQDIVQAVDDVLKNYK